jgi:transposase
LTSNYFEGKTCPLAAFGHDGDGKKGKLQVNYRLLTDRRGCPVAVSVVKGNAANPSPATALGPHAKGQPHPGGDSD